MREFHHLNDFWYAARDTAAKLCGIVVLAVQPPHAEGFMTDLITGFADHDVKKHKFELQDGYLAATGYVLAQSMTGSSDSVPLCPCECINLFRMTLCCMYSYLLISST